MNESRWWEVVYSMGTGNVTMPHCQVDDPAPVERTVEDLYDYMLESLESFLHEDDDEDEETRLEVKAWRDAITRRLERLRKQGAENAHLARE